MPVPGAKVALRHRIPGSPTVVARIVDVGPRYEPVPRHHLLDPQIDEWGRPVRIVLPKGFKVSPGELVDITFLSPTKK